MRSTWKIKPYLISGYSISNLNVDNEIKCFKKKGYLNPFFYDKRINIYRGNSFRNFKVRKEMITLRFGSFILSRPNFNSIRSKFKSINKK
jgi:ribosomal protein S19